MCLAAAYVIHEVVVNLLGHVSGATLLVEVLPLLDDSCTHAQQWLLQFNTFGGARVLCGQRRQFRNKSDFGMFLVVSWLH